MNQSPQSEMALPPVLQPKGLAYLWGTWSGRLLIINTIVFLGMSWRSGSLVMPTPEVLLAFGAKDPVMLAQGEYWRFFTPIFVHIGFLHYFFNSLGLYYIGYQLERLLGASWFLLIYLLAGTIGNISSAVFYTTAVSAGASGALFGLLGAGFYLERAIGRRMQELTGQRPRRGIYSGMVIINLLFGLVVPGIDNAAHLGGMLTGVILTYAMVHLRPNRLRSYNKPLGAAIILGWLAFAGLGVYLGMSKSFILMHLERAAQAASEPGEAYRDYTQALSLASNDTKLHFLRGRLLMLHGDESEDAAAAMADLQIAANDPALTADFTALTAELEKDGRPVDAVKVAKLAASSQPDL